MILFSHPTGNANVRHAALGLQRAGLLGEFWTSVHYGVPSWLGGMLPRKWSQQLQRRAYPDELKPRLRTHPWREATRLVAGRVGLHRLIEHEVGPCSVDGVYRALDRRVAARLRGSDFAGVYAYEDGAEASFRAAKDLGRVTIYDQPIGYWRAARQLLEDEAIREPEWASTLSGNRDSAAKNARKDAELGMADVVLVASSFTKRTLEQAGIMRARVAVIPYGAPLPPANAASGVERKPADKLRVLFVGSLGQRKGLSYLFQAMQLLGGEAELTVIGRRPAEPCAALDRALGRVRYIPSAPHSEILRVMAAHDVFVFPSLFEGFGLVLLEAMAMGLPIIATPHTAAPDLITDGVQGHLVPIRSAEAIAEKLSALRRDPARRQDMGRLAMSRAREFTWKRYETILATRVAEGLAAAGVDVPGYTQHAPTEAPLPGMTPRK